MKKIAKYFFRKNDLFIYLFILFISIIPFFILTSNEVNIIKGEGNYVEINFGGKIFLYHLNQDRLIELKEGLIIIEIKKNKVRVKQSDCKDKICVKKGWIEKKGQFIICMPNKLVIKIVGKDDYDSISY